MCVDQSYGSIQTDTIGTARGSTTEQYAHCVIYIILLSPLILESLQLGIWIWKQCWSTYGFTQTSKVEYLCIWLWGRIDSGLTHYCDAIVGIVASQITSFTIVYTTVYSDADQSKHQSCASLAFVWGSHRVPVNSPHKWSVTRKMFPFDDVIIRSYKLDCPK